MARKRKHPLVGQFLVRAADEFALANNIGEVESEEAAVEAAIDYTDDGEYIVVSQIVSVRRVSRIAEEATPE